MDLWVDKRNRFLLFGLCKLDEFDSGTDVIWKWFGCLFTEDAGVLALTQLPRADMGRFKINFPLAAT
jgi:hypothetical protein